MSASQKYINMDPGMIRWSFDAHTRAIIVILLKTVLIFIMLFFLVFLAWLPVFIKSTNTEYKDPDWMQEFWSPIDVDFGNDNDPIISLCKLNFKNYSRSPHLFPMSPILEKNSSCSDERLIKERLSLLWSEVESQKGTPKGRVLTPSGFIFHESRSGSTLVSNILGTDPWSLVFSESTITAKLLSPCEEGCDRRWRVDYFRKVVTLMGHSPYHKRLFIKFQSIGSTAMDIALEVHLSYSHFDLW